MYYANLISFSLSSYWMRVNRLRYYLSATFDGFIVLLISSSTIVLLEAANFGKLDLILVLLIVFPKLTPLWLGFILPVAEKFALIF